MKIASFTIIRGSVPLKWTQNPSLKYTPSINIKKDQNIYTEKHLK